MLVATEVRGTCALGAKAAAEPARIAAIELNNGRAAQFGILGLMMHEQLGGSIPIVGEM